MSDDPFALLRAKRTRGPGLTTEALVARLAAWRAACDFRVSAAHRNNLVLEFAALPADLDEFAAEVYALCPDVIDRGFGTWGELARSWAAVGARPPADVRELAEGLDLDAPGVGLELLKRSLRRTRRLHLHWGLG